MGGLCSSGDQEINADFITGDTQFSFKKSETFMGSTGFQKDFYEKSDDHDHIKGRIVKHNSVSSKRAQKEYKNGMVEVVRF